MASIRAERRKAIQKKAATGRNFRSAREHTSSGQSQAIWTFVVALAVVLAAMLHANQPTRYLTSTPQVMNEKPYMSQAKSENLEEIPFVNSADSSRSSSNKSF